uniref:Large ribosomal subunit protein mL49 n=1 Tax=Panagrellus redivivus TaxID=6233 RepID=A0A7E4VZS9_PANRE
MAKRLSTVLSRCRVLQSSNIRYFSSEKPWENPWEHALPKQSETFTTFKESPVNWANIERLLPRSTIPPMPRATDGPFPSGWQAPQDPPPALPYFIGRTRYHLPPLFLERRRDELNPMTMDFEYVELVALKEISGDVFACDVDLKNFLEAELGHPVATYVDELKGMIKVKGAPRKLLEKFVYAQGF